MAKDRDESAADEKTTAESSTDEKAEETAAASADDDSAKKDEAAASAGDDSAKKAAASADDDSAKKDEAAASADDEDEGDDEDVEDSADQDEDVEDSADEDEDVEDSADEDDEDVEDSADEDDEDVDDEGRRDEKVAAKGRRDEKVAAKGAAREEPSQERTRLMILGAVLVGLIVVAVIAYTDGSGGEEEPAEGEITDATEEGTTTPEKAPPNPFEQLAQQQQGPPPIPAPEDVGQPPQDAERSESGLAWKVLEEGTGTEHPSESDLVTIHYTGWTGDGRMVDSSVARDEPAEIPLSRAVPGWKEGVPLMVVGEKRRFWVPPELADTGRGPPPGPITFDVELLAFEPAPEPPDPPRHLSGPPPNAQRTESGLAYRVLQRGSGTENPSARSRVRAHFTGWTSDGEMLDTSVVTGEPALLPSLQRVLPGMREGIQMMVVGEKRRLWIPEELAFNGRPGAPEGMLVFDIELVEILEPPPNHPGMPGMPGGHPPTGGAPPNHPPMPQGGGGGPPG